MFPRRSNMSKIHPLDLLLAGLGALVEAEVVATNDNAERRQLDFGVLHKVSLQWVDLGQGAEPAATPSAPSPTKDQFPIRVQTLIGKNFELNCKPSDTILSLKLPLEKLEGIPVGQQRLLYAGSELENDQTIADYKIGKNATLYLVQRLKGGGVAAYLLNEGLLEPSFDYDFTNVNDVGAFTRGSRPYRRPCGWRRYALKVVGRYENDIWLGCSGTDPREWPVSYHGTTGNSVANIATVGYQLDKGVRFSYGKGIYSSESPTTAEAYAQQFVHENKNYKVMLQNRYDPARTTAFGDILLTNEESAIRPYGVLIKQC